MTIPDRPTSDPDLATAERFTTRSEGQNGARANGTGRSTRSTASNSLPPPLERTPPNRPDEQIAAQIPFTIRRPARKGLRLDRLLFLVAIGLLSLTALVFLINRLLAGQRNSPPVESSAPVAPSVPPSATGTPSPNATPPSPPATTEPLTETTAVTVIQSWLTAKTAAMGNQHQTSALSEILADPLLSQWRTRSEKARAENWYWQFEHANVEIVSVTTSTGTAESSSNGSGSAAASEAGSAASSDPEGNSSGTSASGSPSSADTPSTGAAGSSTGSGNAANNSSGQTGSGQTGTTAESDRAEIEAIVTEKGDLFVNGQLDQSFSYEESIRARYSLVRSQGQWRIESVDVLQ